MQRGTGTSETHLSPDRVVALLTLVAAAWYSWQAWHLPRFQMTVVVDAHVFPLAVGVALAVVSALVALRPSHAAGQDAPAEGFTWRSPSIVNAVGVVAIACLYIYLLEPLGFVLSTFLLMMAVPPVLGWRRWVTLVIFAALFSLGIWYFFSGLLMVPLPRGLWPS